MSKPGKQCSLNALLSPVNITLPSGALLAVITMLCASAGSPRMSIRAENSLRLTVTRFCFGVGIIVFLKLSLLNLSSDTAPKHLALIVAN